MKGKIEFEIKNARTSFKHVFERNITVIRGDSATGKSTLVRMVRSLEYQGVSSGVKLRCDKECRVLEGKDWYERLENIRNSLVFIDEGDSFVSTKAFAEAIRNTDNYYVIAARAPMYELPYSIDSIFEVITKGKGHKFHKLYDGLGIKDFFASGFDIIITEDTNSGFIFFGSVAGRYEKIAVSAGGKTKILEIIKKYSEKKVLVVADAAALGAESDSLFSYQRMNPEKISFLLPESFEWMLLKSNLIKNKDIPAILSDPAEYIDSREYFSWEQYFTDILIASTKGDRLLQYSKKKLKPYYLNEKNADKILSIEF